MGQTCIKDIDDHDLLIDVASIANLYDFQPAQWPNDPNLMKLLDKSPVAPGDKKNKPYKHRHFQRYYWGGWANGKPYGKGIYFLCQNGKKLYYEGEVNGQPNGQGHVVFNDGEWEYQGNIINGQADGNGKMKNRKQGYKFEGEWNDSKPYKGLLILRPKIIKTNPNQEQTKDSKLIEGDTFISIDQSHNESIIKYPDGRVYTGPIDKKKFIPHGIGKVLYPDKTEYIGQWYQGEMHGVGKFQWSDGSCYNGDYMFGKKHGTGKFQYNNGKIYNGKWVEGKQHGQGILYSKDGQILKQGFWKHGQFVGAK